MKKVGILIVGHGSPRAEAHRRLVALLGPIAKRLGGAPVLPTFFSIARPNIPDQVAELVSRGITRILLMPYFLYTGQHVRHDIPELLDACRREHPKLDIEVLDTLENEPAVEDVVVDRLAPLVQGAQNLPTQGWAIEERSHEIIESQIGSALPPDPAERAIVRRIVHATADLSFARSIRIHERAVAAGIAALNAGHTIFCDVTMLAAGVTKVRGKVACAINDPSVARAAAQANTTRAAAAMEAMADHLHGAIVAIGNAPTALWKVLELARTEGIRPALVVGMPVGFVGAQESKLALAASDLCYITNVTPRGGSPAAAAAVNALAMLAKERAGA